MKIYELWRQLETLFKDVPFEVVHAIYLDIQKEEEYNEKLRKVLGE